MPTTGTPIPGIYTGEASPQNAWLRKPMGDFPGGAVDKNPPARTRTKNFTICMETQKTPNSQSNLENEKWSWRNQAP